MKNIITLWVVVVLLVISYVAIPVHAQESCGSIIAPENWGDLESPLTTISIINCSDPFQKSSGASPYTLIVNNAVVGEGNELLLLDGKVTGYEVSGWVPMRSAYSLLFFHDGADYRFINMDPSVPSEADYRTFAGEYFPSGTDIEPYISAALDPELRFSMDYDMRDILYAYLDYVDQHFVSQFPTLTAGTYTLVTHEYELMVTKADFLQKLFAYIIPTAYAQSVPEPTTYTLTFTVKTEEAPIGISNILFLPGIEASRLYTEIDGKEEKVWEPGGDDDIELLRMTDTGESVHNVYTKDVVDEKGGVAIGGNVYKGFLQYLQDIEGPFAGPIVETFPYDWRYDVFDVVENGTKVSPTEVKKPIDRLVLLAGTSQTEKVTIIAHSNGGLLAKAIMLKLKEIGRADLVDKVIFIASPHIGTPKGIAALLHGYDQELLSGLLASDERVRDVMKNMPGVYGLLPSETYIESLSEPLISFDDSSTTKMYRDAYGFTLTNVDEYTRFLNGNEGREEPGDVITKPSIANAGMLSRAFSEHREKLDSWSAPAGVEVFNIVGTGLPTPKSIEYKEFPEVHCSGGVMVSCTEPVAKLEAVLHFTRYGDKTVVSKSAKHVGGEMLYFNLPLEAVGVSNFENEHVDITESETTQVLVDHILHGSSTNGIEFISNTEPSFTNNVDIYKIHSPAHIYLRDNNGNITGKTEVGGEWKSEIPGSDYFEAGGVKYVLVPSDSAYTVVIEGEDNGIYTHSMSTLVSEVETEHHFYTASVTPMSIMTYSKDEYGEFSTISIDENGDGMSDKEMTLEGEIIEKEVTYDDLESAIRELKLSKKFERPLLVLVAQAEKLSHHHVKKHKKVHAEDVLLRVIEKQLAWYRKMQLVTDAQFKRIGDIIMKLIEK